MIGTQLGRWIVDQELGTGAMGRVYRAHAADAPEEVRALKVLTPDLARDPVARQRFQRETEVLCSLDHPNIVRYDGAGVEGETLYYVMEYVTGSDCETRLREIGRWPWAEVLDLAIQVTRGLKYAHDRGVVHRDLKPANLLLQRVADESEDSSHPDGIVNTVLQVKIADFGVARVFAHPGQITGSGQFIGTALYMAPEQAAGKPATKRSDFYALGCVLYTLVTGRPPFNGNSLAEMVHKHQFVQPERAGRLLVDLPHDLDDLINQLLAKEPAKRPGDGSVLLKRLESIRGKLIRKHNLEDTAFRETGSKPEFNLSVEPSSSLPASEESSWKQFFKPIVLGAGLLVCAAGIVYAFVRPRQSAEELFRKAQPLMSSDSPADWERAWNEYLEPMGARFPNHPYRAEVDGFRHLLDNLGALRRMSARQSASGARSEAQVFFELGVARCQNGDIEGGRRIWEQVVNVFHGIEEEERWVRLAQIALRQVPVPNQSQPNSPTVRSAMDRAKRFAQEGNRDSAEAIWQGLESLYRDHAEARELLAEIAAERVRKNPVKN
jgi:serine/threonine-protein kinase